jgi:methylated-DNA-[protein]-cysteine S-methyltransferase
MAPGKTAAAAGSVVETIQVATAFGGRVRALRATVAGGKLIELYFTVRPASPTAAGIPTAIAAPAAPAIAAPAAPAIAIPVASVAIAMSVEAAPDRLAAPPPHRPAAAARRGVSPATEVAAGGQPAALTPPLPEVRRQLGEYFAGRRRDFDLPLAPRGTDFERRVWEALLAIPFGETRTYAEIARAIGHPDACRAVGRANGRNPIPIVIPCHRVIGSDGSLTGFGGGLDLKRLLLEHEGAAWAGSALAVTLQLALPL